MDATTTRPRPTVLPPRDRRQISQTAIMAGLFLFAYVATEQTVSGWVASLALRNRATAQFWAAAPSIFWAGVLAGRAITPTLLKKRLPPSLVFAGLAFAAAGAITLILTQTPVLELTAGPLRHRTCANLSVGGRAVRCPAGQYARTLRHRIRGRKSRRRSGTAGNRLPLANQRQFANWIGDRTAGNCGYGVVAGSHLETIGRPLRRGRLTYCTVVIELREHYPAWSEPSAVLRPSTCRCGLSITAYPIASAPTSYFACWPITWNGIRLRTFRMRQISGPYPRHRAKKPLGKGWVARCRDSGRVSCEYRGLSLPPFVLRDHAQHSLRQIL